MEEVEENRGGRVRGKGEKRGEERRKMERGGRRKSREGIERG